MTGTNKLAGVEIDALVKWVSDGAVPHLLAPSQRATRQAGIAAMLAHSPRETRAG